jgi:hypothetical protein
VNFHLDLYLGDKIKIPHELAIEFLQGVKAHLHTMFQLFLMHAYEKAFACVNPKIVKRY